MGKRIKSKQVNKTLTTLVRIDRGLHRMAKIQAATEKTTIRDLVEYGLANVLKVDISKYLKS